MSKYNPEDLQNFLKQYSFADIAKSLFILSMWVPNRSAMVQFQYAYVTLESFFNQLNTEDKISDYRQFQQFSNKLIKLLPSFPMLEDYIPEGDWGDIKYFFNKNLYKIFYGGDLSNQYDYYYAFETTHIKNDDIYIEHLERSVTEEFEFCLSFQDYLISNLKCGADEGIEISPGDIKVPGVIFWQDAQGFINEFNKSTYLDSDVAEVFTKNLNEGVETPLPSMTDFSQNAHNGSNSQYFFIKKGDLVTPVLCRKYLTVLYDSWGKNLSILQGKSVNLTNKIQENLVFGVIDFISDRSQSDDTFLYISPINKEQEPIEVSIPVAFKSKDRIVFINILNITKDSNLVQEEILRINEQNKLIDSTIELKPLRMLLIGRKEAVEFRPKNDDKPLTPTFITIIPKPDTSMGLAYGAEDLIGQYYGLDEFLAILDSLESIKDIASFIDYEENHSRLNPFNSAVDRLGSFMDGSGVLLEGARVFDGITLDTHWGSSYRRRYLADFWLNYPDQNFFGNPRGWNIKLTEGVKSKVLVSKVWNTFAYSTEVGNSFVFANCPAHSLNETQGVLTESMMGSTMDAFDQYEAVAKKLTFFQEANKVHLLFFPSNIVKDNSEYAHLIHLLPGKNPWNIDTAKISSGDYGVRIVFNEEMVAELLQDAKDRSFQIDLYSSLLEKISELLNEADVSEILSLLNVEKNKPNRFRVFGIERNVSFPSYSPVTIPDDFHYKIARKRLAEISKENSIQPGKFFGDEAKKYIGRLRECYVDFINTEVSKFNLAKSLPLVLTNTDSFVNDYEKKKAMVHNSIDQEVNYQRGSTLGKDKGEFLHHHKNNKYLIEKMVQLNVLEGGKKITKEDLQRLIAYVDVLFDLIEADDQLHYGLTEISVEITRDFLVNIQFGNDINKKHRDYATKQSKIALGEIGKKEDCLVYPGNIKDYVMDLNVSMKSDVNFSFSTLVNVQHILSEWARYCEDVEVETSYSASKEKIIDICDEKLSDTSREEITLVVDFIILRSDKVLTVGQEGQVTKDLPVWEHRKRLHRYSLRSLIEVNDVMYWGAFSMQRSSTVWGNVPQSYKLPADVPLKNTEAILKEKHKEIESVLQDKITEITKRFSNHVKNEVDPFRMRLHPTDIGDIDVLVYLEQKNILLNIESKTIDKAFCNKDLKRVSEKIFGKVSSKGIFKKGYLQRVEDRESYLTENADNLVKEVFNLDCKGVQVVSLFVTDSHFWWTEYPIQETTVKFVELAMLDDTLTEIIG